MTVYRYQTLANLQRRRLSCVTCGQKFNRQHTFTMTINPWNCNADGTVRTSREVTDALSDQAKAWQPAPICGKCDAWSS